MGLKFNREEVSLGAIPVGAYPTDTSTTPAPTGLPHRAVDWGLLTSGPPGSMLTANADGSIGWTQSAGTLTVGAPVTSPVDNAVLFINAAGNVGASATLTYDGSAILTSTASVFKIVSATQTQFSGTGFYNYYTFCYGPTPSFAIYCNAAAGSTIGYSNGDSLINFNQHSTIYVTPYSAATTPFAVRGLASQTAPLFPLQQLSSTAAARNCGIIDASFNTATDASWTGNLLLYAGDNTSSNAGKRLGVQIQSNGSAALVGLFGATPVVQPVGGGGNTTMTANTGTAVLAGSTFTGATGSSTYTVGDIVTALKALGILTA